MCHRREKEINASYFLPGTPAYKANCMFGGVPFLLEQAGGRAMAASAPLAAGGATYASAAAGSTRVPVVRQPAAPVARAPAQQQSLSPMLESRFQAIEAVQMALKNDVAGVPGEVRKLTDLVLALQKEVASLRRQLQGVNGLERRSTPTKKTASPRGGKGGKQKRKHSRSRSPSPALTHTTSFSALAQEDSEDDTQGNQSMSDNEWKQVSTKTKQRTSHNQPSSSSSSSNSSSSAFSSSKPTYSRSPLKGGVREHAKLSTTTNTIIQSILFKGNPGLSPCAEATDLINALGVSVASLFGRSKANNQTLPRLLQAIKLSLRSDKWSGHPLLATVREDLIQSELQRGEGLLASLFNSSSASSSNHE
jgi:hypothetical protein